MRIKDIDFSLYNYGNVDFMEIINRDSPRFQDELAAYVLKHNLKTILETGVSYGVSTYKLLGALEQTGGHLYSCDPNPAYRIPHERWTLFLEESYKALESIYGLSGPLDLFLHDSDHEVYCQTFEYEVGWHITKAGGIIGSDDYSWGGHGAWSSFLERHNVRDIKYFGSMAYFIRDDSPRMSIKDAVNYGHELAAKRSHIGP
jgi:predicted O-methyltransferase YrrM